MINNNEELTVNDLINDIKSNIKQASASLLPMKPVLSDLISTV